MADFEFDVGITVEEIRGDFEVIDESARQLGAVVEGVASSFIRMEEQASSLGLSMQEVSGITKETADNYKDFIRTFTASTALQGSTLNFFSGLTRELDNLGRSFSNVVALFQDEEAVDEPGLGNLRKALGPLLFGKRVARISTHAARIRDNVRFAREAKLRRDIEKDFSEERDELNRSLEERVANRRLRFTQQGARSARQERLEQRLDEVDAQEFVAQLALARERFQATQILDPGRATVANRIAQQIRAQQFDIGQDFARRGRAIREQAETERRDLRKANQADEAMIRLQQDVRSITEPILRAIQKLEQERDVKLSLVEDVVP